MRLFTAGGWHASHDTLDLVADLPDYRAPALAPGNAARACVTITPAAAADRYQHGFSTRSGNDGK